MDRKLCGRVQLLPFSGMSRHLYRTCEKNNENLPEGNVGPCGSSNCVIPIYIAETILLEPTCSLSQDLSLDH